jgi:hypothetical protein
MTPARAVRVTAPGAIHRNDQEYEPAASADVSFSWSEIDTVPAVADTTLAVKSSTAEPSTRLVMLAATV